MIPSADSFIHHDNVRWAIIVMSEASMNNLEAPESEGVRGKLRPRIITYARRSKVETICVPDISTILTKISAKTLALIGRVYVNCLLRSYRIDSTKTRMVKTFTRLLAPVQTTHLLILPCFSLGCYPCVCRVQIQYAVDIVYRIAWWMPECCSAKIDIQGPPLLRSLRSSVGY